MQDPKENDKVMETANDPENGPSTDTAEPTAEQKYATYMKQVESVPPALPLGWVVRYSRSQPDYQYFFHQDTGACQWEIPLVRNPSNGTNTTTPSKKMVLIDTDSLLSAVIQQASHQEQGSRPIDPKNTNLYQMEPSKGSTNASDVHSSASKPISATAPPPAAPSGILKRKSHYSDPSNPNINTNVNTAPVSTTTSSSSHRSSSKRSRKDHPKEVRVLHILKKHAKSRRPSSWRTRHITISREEAIGELEELISMLKEVEEMNDPKELRATFEELAKTESDCSSSKRGGDLGFFGRKKMQPAFEKASFALKVCELSGIVETSSGVHVIMRLG